MVRKIRDLNIIDACNHPEHNTPTMLHLEPGVYEHICPGCGNRIEFTVPLVTC